MLVAIKNYQEKLKKFVPNEDEKEEHKAKIERSEQWLLLIADAFEYNLNKNLKSYPIAIDIYSSFILQIKGKNPEKTKSLEMPQPPGEEQILAYVKKHKSSAEYNKLYKWIVEYGIESLMQPTLQMKDYVELKLFREALDALNQKYKNDMHDVMKKFDAIKSELKLSKTESKALN